MSHYTEGQFISFIQRSFGDGKLDGRKNNIQLVCPFCRNAKGGSYSKRKLAIKTTKPHFVHCWVCGYKNRNIYKLLARWAPEHLSEYKDSFLDAEELKASEAEVTQTYKPIVLPKGFTLLADASARLTSFDTYQRRYFEKAIEYLNSRGIKTQAELWYWKIGITTFYKEGCKDRIIIPSFDCDGTLSYWTGRSWRRNPNKKYNNPYCNRKNVIFNELNIDWKEALTIVEGPFDLLKCNANATCVLGSELTLEYELLQKIIKNRTPVILAFDPDKEGQSKQLELANRFLEFDIPVKIVEHRDKTKDVGDLSKSEFIDLLNSAKTYSTNYHLRLKIASIMQ